MTFLELANRLLSEADISGSGLVTTANQKGEYKLAIDYIKSAYQDIQALHPNWNFLRKEFSFSTIETIKNYSSQSVNITDFGTWSIDTMRVYLTTAGETSEQYLRAVSWDDFRDNFQFGSTRAQTGMPAFVAEKPDNSLIFYPAPNAQYTITGEYFCSPFVFNSDLDTPAFAVRYHMIIVWRALMFFAAQMNAQELYAIGQMEYRRLLFKLEQNDLPHHSIVGALA